MRFQEPRHLADLFFKASVRDRFVFMLGSAISIPDKPNTPGVPGVPAMVEAVKMKLTDDVDRKVLSAKLAKYKGNAYQMAMQFLIARQGQRAADELIQDATGKSVTKGNVTIGPFDISPQGDLDKEPEEFDDLWHLPRGLAAFGKLVALLGRRVGETIITTNFDPLIGVAIRRAGGQYFRICASSDGDLRANGGSVPRIVHLHGYYRNSETLHTGIQLQSARPRLEDSLKMLLVNRTLVVVGYGGWDDIFMRAVADIAAEPRCGTKIVWCFYEDDIKIISSKYARALGILSVAYDRDGLTLIKGFDVNSHLLDLYESMSYREAILRAALRMHIMNIVNPTVSQKSQYKTMESIFRAHLGQGIDQLASEHWLLPRAKLDRLRKAVASSGETTPREILGNAVYEAWLRAVYGDYVQMDVQLDMTKLLEAKVPTIQKVQRSRKESASVKGSERSKQKSASKSSKR